jgi:diketogulonate reductase-like aldo/keto reductase
MQHANPSYYTLANNQRIPIIGLGTADMNNVANVVYASIKSGVRLIDTAERYQNETQVGEGIKRAIDDKIVTREELFIITKLSTYEKTDPINGCLQSLKRLQVEYVDLFLDHWPSSPKIKNGKVFPSEPLHVYWPKMEALVEQGYARGIGVCNFNVQSICNLLSFCKIKPVVLQVEYHPYLYQKSLREFCRRFNIQMMAYNSLCKGAYVYLHDKEVQVDLLKEEVIIKMAEKYKVTPGQIAINWSIAQGIVVIPRTSREDRMEENLKSVEFKLKEEEVEEIAKALNKSVRFNTSLIWGSYDGIDVFA